MKIPEFKIRASGCGKLMGKKGLGKTGLSFAEMWLKEKVYNRRKDIKSKYLEKGNLMEDNSLDEVAKNMGMGILIKNEKHFTNDYMTGTPDAIVKDCVIDVKNSWSWETFPLLETEVPNSDYYFQLQVYMELTGTSKAKLIYTLMDTPEHLIQKEAYWYAKDNGYGELSDEMLSEFVAKMTYPDIPEKYKYKCFEIERNDADIELIKIRVLECRDHLKSFNL